MLSSQHDRIVERIPSASAFFEQLTSKPEIRRFISAQRLAFPRHVGLHYALQSQAAYAKSQMLYNRHIRFIHEIDEARACHHKSCIRDCTIRGTRLRHLARKFVLKWLERLYDPESRCQFYLTQLQSRHFVDAVFNKTQSDS